MSRDASAAATDCIAYSERARSGGIETLGRTSHFRLGKSVGWLTRVTSGATASLELSTSTGVVALLDTDGGRDERSNWSDKEDNEDDEFEDASFVGVPFCIGSNGVVIVGGGGDWGAGALWLVSLLLL